MRVVVLREARKDEVQVPLTEDQQQIAHPPFHRADHPLGERVGVGSPYRGLHDLNTLAAENVVEGSCVLGVAVADQESDLGKFLSYMEVARCLGDEGRVRVLGGSGR